jgi:recombination protein RecT
MTMQTTKNGEIVPRAAAPGDSLLQMLRRMTPEIQRALPKHVSPDRMARMAMTALSTTRGLAECTTPSFIGCVMQAAQLGLEPNTPLGHAWLIPYGKTCTLVVGYQGFIELARRSGMVASVYAYAVRQGDAFEYELGLTPNIKHKPSEDEDREAKPITHVYAVAAMRDSAERVFVVLTKAQVEARRKRSASASKGPWVTDYEAMCLKTAVRSLWKWLPKSAEMARAESLDDAAERGVNQAPVLEPVVAGVLTKEGLIDDAELIDRETGEVTSVGGDDEATKLAAERADLERAKAELAADRERLAASQKADAKIADAKGGKTKGADDKPDQGELVK